MDKDLLVHQLAVDRIYRAKSILHRLKPRLSSGKIQAWVDAAEELSAVSCDVRRYEKQAAMALKDEHAEAMLAKLQELRSRRDQLQNDAARCLNELGPVGEGIVAIVESVARE